MATYKVIQDIEAADHIIGRLTFRQFIFAIISAFCFFLCYMVVAKGLPFLLVIFLPPALISGFFAFPWGRDQPTEVWALAKIRFFFKPRKRVWDQSGAKELVTITAPKQLEKDRTDGLTPVEVKSRLTALANTIDSRGWAIKNVNLNLYNPQLSSTTGSDRLIDISALPQEVPNYDVQAADDILDAQNNPLAKQFDQMISASSQTHHQQLMNMLKTPMNQTVVDRSSKINPPTQPVDYWLLNQPTGGQHHKEGQTEFTKSEILLPNTNDEQIGLPDVKPSDEEILLTKQIRANSSHTPESYSHMHTIQPFGTNTYPTNPPTDPAPLTAPSNPAIIEWSKRNDVNVATIARQFNISKKNDEPQDEEIEISLR